MGWRVITKEAIVAALSVGLALPLPAYAARGGTVRGPGGGSVTTVQGPARGGTVVRGPHGGGATSVRGPYGGGAGAVRGPYGAGAAAVRGPYGGGAAAVRGPYGGSAVGVRGPYGGGAVRGPYGGAAVRSPYYGRGAVVRGPYGGGAVVRGGYGYVRPGWNTNRFYGFQRGFYGRPGWRSYGYRYGLVGPLVGFSSLGFLSSGLLIGSFLANQQTVYVYVVNENGVDVQYQVTDSGVVLSRQELD